MRWRGAALASLLAACAHAPPAGGPPAGPRATAIASGTLRSPTGERVGVAAVTDSEGSLRLALSVGDLSPGLHAVRIEAADRCVPPAKGKANAADTATTRADTTDTSRAVATQTDTTAGSSAAAAARVDTTPESRAPPGIAADSSAAREQDDRGNAEHGMLNQPGPPLGELPDLLAKPDGSADTSFALPRDLPATGPGSVLQPGGTSVVIGAGPSVHPDSAGGGTGQVACTLLGPG